MQTLFERNLSKKHHGLTRASEIVSNRRLSTFDAAWILVLLAAAFFCFANSLKGYFYADDFWHLSYLNQVFSSHPERLLKNFVGVWMDNDVLFLFYRPLTEVTFALDYLFWKANPLGYHITNVAWHALSAIVFYLLSRKLVSSFGLQNSTAVAMVASLLFAVYPLNTEAINWVVGRADPICICFYFASFWMYLRVSNKDSNSDVPGILAFIFALFAKEMAVSLPGVIALHAFFFGPRNRNATLLQRFYASARATLPYAAVLLGYFCVRYYALGTVVGGYQGSFGHLLNSGSIGRWLSLSSLYNLVNPLNDDVFAKDGFIYERALAGLYWLLLANMVCRWRCKLWDHAVTRCILFLIGWFFLEVIPLFQVWSLYPNLMGGRFMYLSTAIICLILALVIVPSFKAGADSVNLPVRALKISSVTIVAGFVSLFVLITARNISPWLNVSNQLISLRKQIEVALSAMPADQKITLVGLPCQLDGARMLYFYTHVRDMFSPPLSTDAVAARVATIEPGFYAPDNLVNATAIRRQLSSANSHTFFWNDEAKHLEKLALPDLSSFPVKDITVKRLYPDVDNERVWLTSNKISINPLEWDSIEFEVSAKSKTGRSTSSVKNLAPLYVRWDNRSDGKSHVVCSLLWADGDKHVYRVPLSETKEWMIYRNPRLVIYSPWKGDINISRVRLLRDDDQLPVLTVADKSVKLGLDGVYVAKNDSILLDYDVSKIPGAKKVILTVSEKNSYFEHYSYSLRDTSVGLQSSSKKELAAVKGQVNLSTSDFSGDGWYQVRIAGISENGNVVGYCSEPINVRIANE